MDIETTVNDAKKIITNSLFTPQVIISTLLAFFLVTSAGPSLNQGVIGNYLIASNNSLTNFILNNAQKVTGVIFFAPSIITLPKDKIYPATGAVILWVSIVPEYSFYEYLIQSTLLYVFFRTKRQNTRMYIIGAAVLAYYVGYITFVPPSPITPPTTRTI